MSKSLSVSKYYGGKAKHANWIMPWLPPSRVYCEPFAGGASVLFQKAPSKVEAISDIDGNLIVLYWVLANEGLWIYLAGLIQATPYAESQYKRALNILNTKSWQDDIERAWATYMALNMSFNGNIAHAGGWSYDKTANSAVSKWNTRKGMFQQWHKRLSKVQIHCAPASKMIERMDSPETTFYLDPPYVLETRQGRKGYANEMTIEDHHALVQQLLGIEGAAVLSGYAHEVYNPLSDAGWMVVKKDVLLSANQAFAKSKAGRTEVLWINPRAIELLNHNKLWKDHENL